MRASPSSGLPAPARRACWSRVPPCGIVRPDHDHHPRFRSPAAPDVAARPLRHRRPGARGVALGGLPRRGRAEAVAGPAARPHRLRRLALPVLLGLRREPVPREPRAAARGRPAGAGGPRGRARVPRRPRGLRPGDRVEARDPGARPTRASRRAPPRACARTTRPSAAHRRAGSRTSRSSWRSRRRTAARPGPRGRRGWPRASPAALAAARERLAVAVDSQRFRQFLFFRQWGAVRAHARAAGIRIIGDLPIFVAHDSADVWAHPELFQLDARGAPAVVAGVPPDYFAKTGQLWGNPLYRWDAHRAGRLRLVDRAAARHASRSWTSCGSTTSAASRRTGRCRAARRRPSRAAG